jgi:hypothetical protein
MDAEVLLHQESFPTFTEHRHSLRLCTGTAFLTHFSGLWLLSSPLHFPAGMRQGLALISCS